MRLSTPQDLPQVGERLHRRRKGVWDRRALVAKLWSSKRPELVSAGGLRRYPMKRGLNGLVCSRWDPRGVGRRIDSQISGALGSCSLGKVIGLNRCKRFGYEYHYQSRGMISTFRKSIGWLSDCREMVPWSSIR